MRGTAQKLLQEYFVSRYTKKRDVYAHINYEVHACIYSHGRFHTILSYSRRLFIFLVTFFPFASLKMKCIVCLCGRKQDGIHKLDIDEKEKNQVVYRCGIVCSRNFVFFNSFAIGSVRACYR